VVRTVGIRREQIEPREARLTKKVSGTDAARSKVKGYYVYTKRFDEVVDAKDICPPDELLSLFAQVRRLSKAFQRRFADYIKKFEQEILVLAKGNRASVYVLIDNSGSLWGSIASVAAWSFTIAELLERNGIRTEIAGYTTRAWKGGRARELWVRDRRPKNPGRLNDLRYIIYKSFDDNVADVATNFGAMLREGLLKENIDGEAVLWAYDRISLEKDNSKVILVLTDGAPADDATLSVNPPNILDLHLKDVLSWIEDQGDVAVCAVGIATDASRFYALTSSASRADDTGPQALGLLSDIWPR
jgi:cobaltochelatase CobT